jgi:hypothetical protein
MVKYDLHQPELRGWNVRLGVHGRRSVENNPKVADVLIVVSVFLSFLVVNMVKCTSPIMTIQVLGLRAIDRNN